MIPYCPRPEVYIQKPTGVYFVILPVHLFKNVIENPLFFFFFF